MSTPYTPEELYELAKKEIEITAPNLRNDLREDAIQEYVIAAHEVTQTKDWSGIKSLQQKRGRSRMVDFLRYEGYRAHPSTDAIEEAIQDSIDIEDSCQLTPLDIVIAKEEAGLL